MVIDHFSEACRLIPLPKLHTALETAESLCDYVFRFYDDDDAFYIALYCVLLYTQSALQ